MNEDEVDELVADFWDERRAVKRDAAKWRAVEAITRDDIGACVLLSKQRCSHCGRFTGQWVPDTDAVFALIKERTERTE